MTERAPTILIVDDDAAWRLLLEDTLRREGFRVIGESRGDRVMATIDLHRPEVVVLDNQLPGATGLFLLAFLHDRWPDLPVLLMTAFGGPLVAEQAQRVGARRYLDKPFPLADLVGEVRRLTRAREASGSDDGRSA